MAQQRIGKYEILARVGKGAMGEVFKARDPVLNRFVAIKIISANLVSDLQFRTRFLQEARSAAQLNHRNIVTVFEFNEDPQQVFMVMEFLEGSDLRDAIARKSVHRLEDRLGIIEQVCEGLSYAHSKGIVHRDLKPANIRLLPNLTAKIMDFGLARLGTSEITRAGTVMGTPDYMSPEQVRAEKVDARADIFSVGAVLYHMLSGRKPFESESVHSILYEVLERDPPPLSDLVPDLPPLVLPIVERALRKNPAQRFQTAAAMRVALRDARRAIAAGRAAAAALAPGEQGEATVTRFDLPPPSYSNISPTGPRLRERSGASLPPPPSSPSMESPPTIAIPSATLVEGATALDLRPAEGSLAVTARPPTTLVESVYEPPPRSGRILLVAAAALVLFGLTGLGTWRMLRPGGPSEAEVQQRRREAAVRQALLDEQVDLARSDLASKNYERAQQEAQAVLAQDPGNADAQKVVSRAREAIELLEKGAAAARAAVGRGDTEAAQRALSDVLAIDPRHEVVAELSLGLNERFRTQAEEARTVAGHARKAADAARAAGQEAFLAADRMLREAEARLQAGEYVEGTRRFTEARDGFDRARRDVENARLAAVRPSAMPSASLTSTPHSPSPATVASISPLPSASAVASPPVLTPSAAPSATSMPTLAPAPSTTVLASPEVGVRRALADYARALETRDVGLFRSVMPGLTPDQEKSLRESFKTVKSQQVTLVVDSIQVEPGRATVRLTRQDTVNGQQRPPRQQTFLLVQRGGSWTIDKLGQ